jgi:hypothetical protein
MTTREISGPPGQGHFTGPAAQSAGQGSRRRRVRLGAAGTTTLSRRTLNLALLQRQFLLERTDRAPLDVIRRLVALQAQEPNWPYLGLWTRIHGFTHAGLTTLLADGRVVRSSLLRGTQHLAAADDFRRLRPVLQPVLDRAANSAYFRRDSDQLRTATLLADGRALLDGGPIARKELAQRLAARHPGHDGRILAGEVELRTPLIHDPATASWGGWGNRSSITVTAVATDPIEPAAIHELVRRYLAAFGPATVADVQAWSGLTRLARVVADLDLRRYTGPDGQTLLDLPDADLPDPDVTAPVRLLPAYDNVLLGHADRSRVISDEDRKRVMPGRALVRPTILIDGFVGGTWSFTGEELRLKPFRPLTGAEQHAVDDEANRMLPFLRP